VASGKDVALSIEDAIQEATREFTEADMLELGHLAQTIITLRTKKGLDADRVPFAPYTKDYANWRNKKSRSSTAVDLAFTGHMQQAEIVTATKSEAVISFSAERQAQIAAWLNDGTRKMKPREWFVVRHPDEVAVMEESIGATLQGRIERLR
jgi:hypothetical protein